ncbi:MAG: tocopherol cyclase family protein [Draconibacterium sp.]|nr:tocopherol cyclase family protein [Draconibacterium sp.]
MGWYSFVPFMECKHGIGSVFHDLNGDVTIDNKRVNFSDGTGYIEKDWGTSFPESWIWLHCNTFNKGRNSFTFSVAKIPWLGSFFMGHICFLYFEGEFYLFATYNNSKIVTLKFANKTLEFELKNRNYHLKVNATQKHSGMLKAPIIGEMNRTIKESINSEIEIELFKNNGELIGQLQGNRAGLEIVEKILGYFK